MNNKMLDELHDLEDNNDDRDSGHLSSPRLFQANEKRQRQRNTEIGYFSWH